MASSVGCAIFGSAGPAGGRRSTWLLLLVETDEPLQNLRSPAGVFGSGCVSDRHPSFCRRSSSAMLSDLVSPFRSQDHSHRSLRVPSATLVPQKGQGPPQHSDQPGSANTPASRTHLSYPLGVLSDRPPQRCQVWVQGRRGNVVACGSGVHGHVQRSLPRVPRGVGIDILFCDHGAHPVRFDAA